MATKMERLDTAGYAAYYRNETVAEACPFLPHTAEYYAWVRGHGRAENEHERAEGPNAPFLLPCRPPMSAGS